MAALWQTAGGSVGKGTTGTLFWVVLTVFSFLPLVVGGLASAGDLPVAVEIHPLNQQEGVPEWKKRWDLARDLVRRAQLRPAADAYRQLLQLKPHIEEARWEYSKVLFSLRDFTTLQPILEGLIENDAERVEYLAMVGRVALIQGEYKRAAASLGQVYALRPEGEYGTDILADLVKALLGTGNNQLVLPLMEQLYRRRSGDQELLLNLARTSKTLGLNLKARTYYLRLVQNHAVSDTLLLEAATLFDEPQATVEGRAIWEKYLQLHPDYLPFHQRLADSYLATDNPQQALAHLSVILDKSPDPDDDLLLTAARIYSENEDRPDKALQYLERYLAAHPERQDVAAKIGKERLKLVRNLLAIIENDGAELLWDDIALLGIDRLALYRLMATRLARAGKGIELAGVLTILAEHDPDRDHYALQLVDLYLTMNDPRQALASLALVRPGNARNFAYWQKKGGLEEQLGMIDQAVTSYRQALQLKSGETRLRSHTLALAGAYGRATDLRRLVDPWLDSVGGGMEPCLAAITNLGQNGLFTTANRLYDQLLKDPALTAADRRRIKFHRSDSLNAQGKVYEAEGQLREMLVQEEEKPEILAALIDLALDANDLENARKWFKILTQMSGDRPWKKSFEPADRRIFLSYIRLRLVGKDRAAAGKELEEYLTALQKHLAGADQKLALPYVKLLAKTYLAKGDSIRSQALLKPYLELAATDPEFAALSCYTEYEISPHTGICPGIAGTLTSDRYLTLLSLAETATLVGKNGEAEKNVRQALGLRPDSLRAVSLEARLAVTAGKTSKAEKLYAKLAAEQPEEEWFGERYNDLLLTVGDYAKLVSRLDKNDSQADFAEKLLFARALWATNKTSEALSHYESLLANSARQEYLSAMERQTSERPQTDQTGKDSLWQIFVFSGSEELAWLDKMIEPSLLIENTDLPESTLTAKYYARFRHEKSAMNEYLARKAILAKKYITAEKQHQKSIKEEQSPIALQDLAGIYKRLGDYGKEAEVYTSLAKQGQQSSVLQESIDRNTLTRAPRLSALAERNSRDGRSGSVDLYQQSSGLDFWFMPSSTSEMQLRLTELDYKPDTVDSPSLEGRQLLAKSTTALSDDTSVNADVGFHLLDSESDTTMIYLLGINHNLDEIIKGYGRYEQEVVADSLASLEQSISRHGFTLGLKLEAPSGFTVGGEFRRLTYSDENAQNRMYLWSSYSVFSEFNTYELKYSYELQNDELTNILSVDPQTGDTTSSLPYWSQGNYWLHNLNFHFQQLLTGFPMFEKAPSYYALDFGIGYESGNSMVYSGKLDIFLEMSNHFLLNGELQHMRSSDYDERGFVLSLVYRW